MAWRWHACTATGPCLQRSPAPSQPACRRGALEGIVCPPCCLALPACRCSAAFKYLCLLLELEYNIGCSFTYEWFFRTFLPCRRPTFSLRLPAGKSMQGMLLRLSELGVKVGLPACLAACDEH